VDNIQKLDIDGARDTVEVDGVLGVFYKIRVGGQVIRRAKGGWAFPMRNGTTSRVTARGIMPGFQRLYFDDVPVYAIGAHVDTPLRIVMFLPFVLIFVNPLFGLVLGALLYFMNISLVKNPLMPHVLRIALPVINTIAGAVILYMVRGLLS
jgi:hypothetical protein